MPMEAVHGWALFFRLLNVSRTRRARDSWNRSATDERFHAKPRHKEPNSRRIPQRGTSNRSASLQDESAMEFLFLRRLQVIRGWRLRSTFSWFGAAPSGNANADYRAGFQIS